jgi:hypothetical protein
LLLSPLDGFHKTLPHAAEEGRGAQTIARHGIVASHRVIVHHVATAASSRPLYDYVVLAPVARRIVTPVLIAPAPAPQHVRAMSALTSLKRQAFSAALPPDLRQALQRGRKGPWMR